MQTVSVLCDECRTKGLIMLILQTGKVKRLRSLLLLYLKLGVRRPKPTLMNISEEEGTMSKRAV